MFDGVVVELGTQGFEVAVEAVLLPLPVVFAVLVDEPAVPVVPVELPPNAPLEEVVHGLLPLPVAPGVELVPLPEVPTVLDALEVPVVPLVFGPGVTGAEVVGPGMLGAGVVVPVAPVVAVPIPVPVPPTVPVVPVVPVVVPGPVLVVPIPVEVPV